MEINFCLSCNEALNTESSETITDSQSMEVSLFEDLNKQKIINKISVSESQVILCKSCSYLLEITLEKQINEAEEYSKNLDFSISRAEELIRELSQKNIPEVSQDEALIIEKEASQVSKRIEKYKKEISKIDCEILDYNKMQIEGIHNMMNRADFFLEHETKSKVFQDELAYLSSKPLLLKAFCFGVEDKIGTINGLKLGRLDYSLTPWDEVNAAWGQCAFLLYVLYEKGGVKSRNFNLYPLGAYSRISYKKDDDQRFGLFFYDVCYTSLIDMYNKAQSLFVEMMKEYLAMSKEFGEPYSIENGKIGGILVKFEPNYKERWTQSLRFLLQDLNYFLQRSVFNNL